jgi:hypothetical protein
MTIRKTLCIAALTALASTATISAASAPLSIGPAAPDAVATYRLRFAGTFWNGAAKSYDHDITLTGTLGGVRASVQKDEVKQTVEFTATRGADGTLLSSNPAEQLSAYNTAARLVSSGPSLAAGTQWDAKIPVPLIDGANVDLPVHARVASIAGDGVLNHATGSHTAAMTYNGFNVPLDFTVALAASFRAGKFERLDYTIDEIVHAGPQTQTMHWTASLEAR